MAAEAFERTGSLPPFIVAMACRSKEATASCAPMRLVIGSQVSCSAPKPFHCRSDCNPVGVRFLQQVSNTCQSVVIGHRATRQWALPGSQWLGGVLRRWTSRTRKALF